MKEYPRYDEDGASDAGCCELREPQAAYGYDPGIAAPMLRLYDPAAATAAPARSAAPTLRLYEPETERASDAADDGFDEPLPEGWEDELMNDPEFQAEAERRVIQMDAELAAGTLVTYTTEEVLDRLHKKYPHVFGGVQEPWYKDILTRKLEASRIAIAEGRVQSNDESWADFWREVRNGSHNSRSP